MPESASERLRQNISIIMSIWSDRVQNEVMAARNQSIYAIKDDVPHFLIQVADALSIGQSKLKKEVGKEAIKETGIEHGHSRAKIKNYTIDQLIWEYRILRSAIFQVMEKSAPLNSTEREIIVGAIEQAVNDAATEFSQAVDRLRESLSTALVHDLRSPITSAKLYADLQLRRADDRTFVIKAATQISENMERLSQMLGDLLDASVLRAGEGVSLQFEECDLQLIAGHVVSEFSELTGSTFSFKSNGPVLGLWSEDGLRRIVENLVTNALKYGTPNSPILIEINQDLHEATLLVHNEGDPIPKEEQHIIFNEFFRLRPTEKPGWGLGLSLVKGIVEALHGKIQVESSKEKGTSFTIVLPKNVMRKVA